MRSIYTKEDLKVIKESEETLREVEKTYHYDKQKIWIWVVFGIIVGALIGYYMTVGVYFIFHTQFDRSYFDSKVEEMMGSVYFDDILVDELILVGYSYNILQPRFYSRFSANKYPDLYNFTVALAVEGASSSPFFFTPLDYING